MTKLDADATDQEQASTRSQWLLAEALGEAFRWKDAAHRAEMRIRELQAKLDAANGFGITIDIDVLGADQREQVFNDILERVMLRAATFPDRSIQDLVAAIKREGI